MQRQYYPLGREREREVMCFVEGRAGQLMHKLDIGVLLWIVAMATLDSTV